MQGSSWEAFLRRCRMWAWQSNRKGEKNAGEPVSIAFFRLLITEHHKSVLRTGAFPHAFII